MRFSVVCFRVDGEFDHLQGFRTEREARAYINENVDGVCLFRLYHCGEVVVESRFPVLMVA